MATKTVLQVVLRARNEAEQAIKGLGNNLDTLKGKLKKHQASFKKMAIAGGFAMGVLTVGMGLAIKEAATAEGSYNKFNTVFGEHKDDMLNFVKDLRGEMPTATHEIVRMAADLQDLLVPLGLSRKKATEMSKGFLDVANKIAAFNDVDPTEVLEAIKSGLAGSSEPLRRYGVNALETALGAKALELGLLGVDEKMSELDPEIKNQIRAQALLAQIYDNSSDAINGFAENNDSFIRRQQDLNASIKETKKALGEALLPMIDKALKGILPFVDKIKDWTEKNKKLTPILLAIGIGLSGLVFTLGMLGIILPGIITLIVILHLSMIPITIAILGVIAVIGLLIAIGWQFYHHWDEIKEGMVIIFEELADTVYDIWENIKDTIKSGINWVIDRMNSFIGQANRIASRVPGIPIIPEIARLAKGGVVTKPTLALVGESGPEAVIPLNRVSRGVGGGNIDITITGNTFMSDEEAAEKVGDMIIDKLKMQMRI